MEPLEPEGYDERYKRWRYEDLPIIPDVWRYRVRSETKKQYDIVARLLKDRRFSEVVCATDAGREGETIFRKVYNLSGKRTGGLDTVSDKYKTREEAVALAEKCRGQRCFVEQITEEAKSKAAPKLYDLTSLQRDANRLFGFTALQTSEYTQNLYEKKLCTYPRTDSRYLTDDMEETATAVIDVVGTKFFPTGHGFEPGIRAVLNSGKVSDHHAIIPTMEIKNLELGDLPDGEAKILLLIANRMICAVSDPYRFKRVYIKLGCNGNYFEAAGTKVIDPGYRKYEDMLKESLYTKLILHSSEKPVFTAFLRGIIFTDT